jgi:hypothetical protein
MNSFFINLKTTIAVILTAIAYALAAPAAQAQTTCSGCTTPMAGLTISGFAGTAGTAASVFEGQKGFSMVTKEGVSTMKITLGAQGGACNGGCGEASYTVQGSAFERATAAGAAFSSGSGVQAGTSNLTRAEAAVGFTKK